MSLPFILNLIRQVGNQIGIKDVKGVLFETPVLVNKAGEVYSCRFAVDLYGPYALIPRLPNKNHCNDTSTNTRKSTIPPLQYGKLSKLSLISTSLADN